MSDSAQEKSKDQLPPPPLNANGSPAVTTKDYRYVGVTNERYVC